MKAAKMSALMAALSVDGALIGWPVRSMRQSITGDRPSARKPWAGFKCTRAPAALQTSCGGRSPARAVAGTAAGAGVVAVAVGNMRFSRYEAVAGGGGLDDDGRGSRGVGAVGQRGRIAR